MEKIITAKKLGMYIIIIIIISSLRNLATDKQDNNNMAASRCPRGSSSFNHTLSGLARYTTVYTPSQRLCQINDRPLATALFLYL